MWPGSLDLPKHEVVQFCQGQSGRELKGVGARSGRVESPEGGVAASGRQVGVPGSVLCLSAACTVGMPTMCAHCQLHVWWMC